MVGRGQGQQLARHELSRAMYHPRTPFLERILDAIGRLVTKANEAVPGGWWALVALAALIVLGVAGVLAWIGPVSRQRRRVADPLLAGARPLSARDHRLQAQRRAAAGEYGLAIIERLRAIAAHLEESGALAARTGRTASELAAEASQSLPGEATALEAAARLFGDVRYGDRPGTADGYLILRDLDDRICAARPSPVTPTAVTVPAW